jgi:heme-degrading monooxygenase HmoA
MYAVIRKGELVHDSKASSEDMIRFLEQRLPRMQEIPGFIGIYALPTGEQEVTTVSFFETAEGVAESNRLAKENVARVRDELGAMNLEISQGEVRLQYGAALGPRVAAAR